MQVKQIIEEEWSYIPVGGPLPLPDNRVTAFGAAANLVCGCCMRDVVPSIAAAFTFLRPPLMCPPLWRPLYFTASWHHRSPCFAFWVAVSFHSVRCRGDVAMMDPLRSENGLQRRSFGFNNRRACRVSSQVSACCVGHRKKPACTKQTAQRFLIKSFQATSASRVFSSPPSPPATSLFLPLLAFSLSLTQYAVYVSVDSVYSAVYIRLDSVHSAAYVSAYPRGLPGGEGPGCLRVPGGGAGGGQVHPATGYSIARSLREAPQLAAHMADVLRARLPPQETSARVWQALWPEEKRRQVSPPSSLLSR